MEAKKKIAEITLEEPIVRGDTKIEVLKLRKPASGELRGLSIADITTLQTDALLALLPRIALPHITEAEAAELDPADLFQCAVEVAGFFLPAAMMPDALARARQTS
jgi:hypothetical protein